MANPKSPLFRLCFVCTGNICRSPMAEAIFRDLVAKAGLSEQISITSAGTGEWHVGEKADPRTRAALARVGYSGEQHRAKQFDTDTFDDFDLILTFDRGQQRVLRAWAETDEQRALIRGLLSFHPEAGERDEILALYLSAVRRGRVDNWDLVDSSSEYLLGASLLAGTDVEAVTALREWGDPGELWWRRVALIATFAFVKTGRPAPTLDLAARYLDDRRDLVQKATGWMLREVGKRVDKDLLVDFLERNAPRMGRTALSYAIERLSPEERRRLRGLS